MVALLFLYFKDLNLAAIRECFGQDWSNDPNNGYLAERMNQFASTPIESLQFLASTNCIEFRIDGAIIFGEMWVWLQDFTIIYNRDNQYEEQVYTTDVSIYLLPYINCIHTLLK